MDNPSPSEVQAFFQSSRRVLNSHQLRNWYDWLYFEVPLDRPRAPPPRLGDLDNSQRQSQRRRRNPLLTAE